MCRLTIRPSQSGDGVIVTLDAESLSRFERRSAVPNFV